MSARRRLVSWLSRGLRFHALRRYEGFRCAFAAMLLLSLVSVVLAAYRLGTVPSATDLLSRLWLSYLWQYWTTHLFLGTFGATFLFALFAINILEEPFNRFVPPPPPHAESAIRDLTLRRSTRVLLLATVVLAALAVPLLHLCVPRSLRIVSVAGAVMVDLLGYAWAVSAPLDSRFRRRLGAFSFPRPPSFNVASMATQSDEVVEELRRYEHLARGMPRSPAALRYVHDGDPDGLWPGYRSMFQRLAGFLGVSPSGLSLHANTAAAVQRALGIADTGKTIVLTTDLEYPTVLEAIRTVVEERLDTVPLRQAHVESGEDVAALQSRIIAYAETKWNSWGSLDRLVLVMSHVTTDTGAVTPVREIVETLSARCKERSIGFIAIIDGAQAVGNIDVGPRVLEGVHFYTFSAHKWLLAKPHLGVLVSNTALLSKVQIDSRNAIDKSIPYSSEAFDPAGSLGQTVNLEPWVALSVMLVELTAIGRSRLAEHNRGMAQLFADLVLRSGVSVVVNPPASGIVTIRLGPRDDAETLKEWLANRSALECEIVDALPARRLEDGRSQRWFLRFSFHYFVSSRDVIDLTSRLNEGIIRLRRRGDLARLGGTP